MREKTKKATFNLTTDVLATLDELTKQGAAPSKNALVEQALIKEFNELKRKTRKAAWEKAAQDPLMLKDVEKIDKDFKYADAETARRIG